MLALEEGAKAAGVDQMCIPGPIPGTPYRSALSEWSDLFQDYLERFKPGHSGDGSVLMLQLGFPPAKTIKIGAQARVRKLLLEHSWPDPTDKSGEYEERCHHSIMDLRVSSSAEEPR